MLQVATLKKYFGLDSRGKSLFQIWLIIRLGCHGNYTNIICISSLHSGASYHTKEYYGSRPGENGLTSNLDFFYILLITRLVSSCLPVANTSTLYAYPH
jgi:hypothetical protein